MLSRFFQSGTWFQTFRFKSGHQCCNALAALVFWAGEFMAIDNQHHLAARLVFTLIKLVRKLAQAATQNLFMKFGQLPRNYGSTLTENLASVFERVNYPMRRFVENEC